MSELIERAKKHPEVLRLQRKRLFDAFDIYKANVRYGVISEDEKTHKEVSEWYQKALDLDEEAISNYPQVLERYL